MCIIDHIRYILVHKLCIECCMCCWLYVCILLSFLYVGHISRYSVSRKSISVDQYRLCIGYFNNIVRCKQQICNTTQYIFDRNNFSHSQYNGIFCSVIIVLSCSVSLYKLAMMSFLLLVASGSMHKGNNKITELRTILQRESQNS